MNTRRTTKGLSNGALRSRRIRFGFLFWLKHLKWGTSQSQAPKCLSGSRWHLALQLYCRMMDTGVLMDVVSCSSVMSALEQGGAGQNMHHWSLRSTIGPKSNISTAQEAHGLPPLHCWQRCQAWSSPPTKSASVSRWCRAGMMVTPKLL